MTAINQEGNITDKVDEDVAVEAKTMVLNLAKKKAIGPRLVTTSASGESKITALNKPKLVIGRSMESDLHLVDPLVSRKHCVIEKRNKGFFIRNVSTTNPLLLNDKEIAEKRLYTGDQIKIGSIMLAFISDRPEDARRTDTIVTENKRSGWGPWFAVCLVLLFTIYFGYSNAYTPWKVRWALKSVSKQIQSGKYEAAQEMLKRLLDLDLPAEHGHRAMQLLAESALAITQQKAQHENLEAAMDYLKAYLSDYGAGKEAEILWDRLDYYRLTLGQRLESAKEFQPALRQYAAIKEDSIYFEEAHKAMRRIWLAHQQQSRQDQTLAQLLKEADAHFHAKQYLKPVKKNAYALYQAVLTLEPEHGLALQRIDQMKTFYRENGEKYFAKENWSKALSFFERYYLIDTETKEIKDKIRFCREKLADARAIAQKSERTTTALKKESKTNQAQDQANEQDEKREEIKRLLEESGTESSWIMKYLFEDQNAETDSEKPW